MTDQQLPTSLDVHNPSRELDDRWPTSGICTAMLREIENAWDAGCPWSPHPRAATDGRYAVRNLSKIFDVRADVVKAMLDAWQIGGTLSFEMVDKKTKLMGLKVLTNQSGNPLRPATNRHPVDELSELREQISRLQGRADYLRRMILAGDCSLNGDDHRAVIQQSQREGLDTKALRKEFGDRRLQSFITRTTIDWIVIREGGSPEPDYVDDGEF